MTWGGVRMMLVRLRGDVREVSPPIFGGSPPRSPPSPSPSHGVTLPPKAPRRRCPEGSQPVAGGSQPVAEGSRPVSDGSPPLPQRRASGFVEVVVWVREVA
jgi:hypothetical protein